MTKLGTLIARPQREADDAQFAGVKDLDVSQTEAVETALEWFDRVQRREARQLRTLVGLAGAGKTTVTGVIAREIAALDIPIAYAAPTGKAASVLRRSLRAQGLKGEATTLHRLMYQPRARDGDIEWVRKDLSEFGLIVVDEASMLSTDLLDDLMASRVPILAVGDHGQLPPVGEDTSVLENPDSELREIHRQADGNPVLDFCYCVRRGGDWRTMLRQSKDERLQMIPKAGATMYLGRRFADAADRPMSEDPMVICASNRTRKMLAAATRLYLPKDDLLVAGDRVICLKNAYMQSLLANGFRGRVISAKKCPEPRHIEATIVFEDDEFELLNGRCCRAQIGQEKVLLSPKEAGCGSWEQAGLLFDYGGALTAHKAQGSQSREAIVYVEDYMGDEDYFRRHLYTGASRAQERLIVML